MSFDVEQHVWYRIANAPIRGYPFPHIYVEDVFPDDYYRALREHLPERDAYQRLDETGTVAKGMYEERYIVASSELEEREFERGAGAFWAELNSWILGAGFAQLLLAKFRREIEQRFEERAEVQTDVDCRLVRDFTNYAIAPHTDTPRKLVSLLFYLPPDDRLRHLGTSIYAPLDPRLRCDGTVNHARELFKKVATMEYRPNTLFGFFKTDRAFHGVDRIADVEVVRDLMLYNLYVKKVVVRGPPAKPGLARSSQREKA
jgi:hypothetical protein